MELLTPEELKNERKRIKFSNWLIVLFIFTIASIFFAMMTVGAIVQSSKYPIGLSTAVVEDMWVMFAYLPIPIASIILGIIGHKQGIKCKKNIIGGAIIAFFLFIYGCLGFTAKGNCSHDYSYLKDAGNTAYIAMPEKAYVTAELSNGTVVRVQARFEDDEFYNNISEYKWRTDLTFVPTGALNMIDQVVTADYDYYLVYNLATEKYNDFNGVNGNYIFMAYDVSAKEVYISYYYNPNDLRIGA